jgi:hypothetical protein
LALVKLFWVLNRHPNLLKELKSIGDLRMGTSAGSGFACFRQEANTFASQSTTYTDRCAVCPPTGGALEGSIVMEFNRVHAAAHIGHVHNGVTAGLK